MPLEFSGAAYRFGHSLIRQEYTVNDDKQNVKIFDPDISEGFTPVPTDSVISWENFFRTSNSANPQMSRNIDNKLATALLELPFVEDEDPNNKSLAVRNLLRGKQLGLPSGQAVAKFMGPRLSQGPSRVRVLTSDEIGLSGPIDASDLPADTAAPLWYSILSEAGVQNNGEHLGKVGSRIVAETIFGFIETDDTSYLTANPGWTPGNPETEQPSPLPRSVSTGNDFTMGDLAAFATS